MSGREPSGVSVVVIGPDDVIKRTGVDGSPGHASVGRIAFEGLVPKEREPLEHALHESRSTKELRVLGPRGAKEPGQRWKHVFFPLDSPDGDVVWIERDLAHYDTLLRESRRSEILLRHSSEVLNLLDQDLRILYRSPSPERPLGYADGLVGRSALEILHPDDRGAALAALGKVLEGPDAVGRAIVRAKHADGTWRVLHATATNLLAEREIQAILLSYRDITEERRADEQLLEASRLASIGTLFAGVGHEINNPLTYVLANLDRVLELLLSPAGTADARAALSQTFELVAEARDGAQRIAKIVGDLKLLSIPERDELVAVDVDAAAQRALTIVDNQLRARARVKRKLGKPPPALAVESRLVQALINLLVNACQALSADFSRNEIEICTAGRGDVVVVSVKDNGFGMAEDVKARIFEPFFTTKSSGGSGLGLWLVKGIVEGFGGRVEVTSESGRGSTFDVVLRRAPAETSEPRGVPVGSVRLVKQGRVLVVDDERTVASALSRALTPGNEVSTAGSGYEVLERLSLGERWDVIVCDLVMPGLNGLGLRHRVMQLAPELADKFVFVSGGAFDPLLREQMAGLGLGYLDKPPERNTLRAAVAKLVR